MMTLLLLIMTVFAGVFAILFYTTTCTCSTDMIEGDKSSVTNTNIEILSYDTRKEEVKVEKGDDEEKICPKVPPPVNCLTTWRLIEVLVVILIVILVIKGTMSCVLGSHKRLSEKVQKKAAQKKEKEEKKMDSKWKEYMEQKTKKDETVKEEQKEAVYVS